VPRQIYDPLRRLCNVQIFRADDGICNVGGDVGSQRNAIVYLEIGYMHFLTAAHWHSIKGLVETVDQ
jgi:hypothetical protein